MANTVELYGFSTVETVEAVKLFVEGITGEGTVCNVEVGQSKASPRAYAKVQFNDSSCAETVISLAQNRLWYGDSYLKVRALKGVNRVVEDAKLLFGNRVSKDKLSVLWEKEDVSVRFGEGQRKLNFLFSFESMDYKLELSFESILQTELLCPPNQPTKFLLFQLFGGVRIFRRQICDSVWVRDVDFSPSGCIGQSSAICLEIPSDLQLPEVNVGFVNYKEVEGTFFLKECHSLSSISKAIPVLLPPQGIRLPYKIMFKVNSLVQHGCIARENLDLDFFRLVDPTIIKLEYIESALDKLYHLKDCCYDPMRWLTTQYTTYGKCARITETPTIALEDGLVYVHRAQITPTKVYFCGPEISLSNRVLRKYKNDIENFLRVSFVDEDFGRLHSSDLSLRSNSNEKKGRTRVYERIHSILRDGIVIGDKKFDFLAYSSSQLRESSAWMFASRDDLTASDIREWMGDFSSIRNVAKHAARLGQSFGSSRETLKVHSDEVDLISDITVTRGSNKYCFSDGIGKISEDLAKEVAAKCGLHKFTPSAFQIRFGGYKGVVAIDPNSSMKLSLRDSMSKYKSENRKLDVLSWSKYQPCYLNRQLITLLSTLGVTDRIFLKKQKEALSRLDAILCDPLRAQEELDLMFPGEMTIVLKEILSCGYKLDQEPFLSMMLRALHATKLLEIKSKTRIFIRHGRAMMGCLDETGTLEYGQVFVQCSNRQHNGTDSHNVIIEENVVVAKNPCLHPGDMRVLMAVDVPELHHMVDCVVFPQKGNRPHPNECSGSDLDGDMYFVCWDRDLIPPQQFRAMDYTPKGAIELDRDVTIEDITTYFVDYILDDNLGIISHAHTVFADQMAQMARSKQCIELAELYSIAVDFCKTGVPAKIPRHLRARQYPDFMENQHKPAYKSKRVIGKLFQQVKRIEDRLSSFKSFTREVAIACYDSEMEVDGFEDFIEDSLKHKSEYDYKLGNLMDYYGIKTEAELLSGNVFQRSRHYDKKKDMESANYGVRSLIREARKWFDETGNGCDNVCAKKASAWYHVTYHPRYWGSYNQDMSRDHFLSFAWCVSNQLCAIKMSKTKT